MLAENFLLANTAKKRSVSTKVKHESSEKVLPKNKFAIAVASLCELTGITRNDTFYRCEYDLDDIRRAIESDSYLKVAVQKFKQLFFKAGYQFKGKNDKAVEYLNTRFRIMDFCSGQSMPVIFREIASDLESYSNAFLIKTRVDNVPFIQAKGITKSEKPVGRYSRINPANIQIQYDKNGVLKAYKQKTISGKEKVFSPDDVIHFTLDKAPGSVWGTPRWVAVLEDIKMLRQAEGNMLSLIYRFALPLYQMIIGLAQPGMEGTKKEIDDAKRTIEKTPMDGIYVTNERTQLKVIGSEGNALDMTGYLSYCEKRVFSGLNMSEAMMGRGGAKQDADSMSEQTHNIIKDDQAVFAEQFKHAIINELLIEGGFNPILNEDDIVELCFNEINLDTKIKLENHLTNLWEKDALTFEEFRQKLGEKSESVDTTRLHSNMIQQANTLEQLDVQQENAIELAKVSGEIQKDIAKQGAVASAASGSGYTKKNTGNGKTRKSASTSKTVSNNDSPQNQHGTYSAKVRESIRNEGFADKFCDAYRRLAKDAARINPDIFMLESYKQWFQEALAVRINEAAAAGTEAAFSDIGKNGQKPSIPFTSNALGRYADATLGHIFCDIKEKLGNSTSGCNIRSELEAMEYRMKFLADYTESKSYWYAYAKTLAFIGIKEAQICGNPNSKHADRHVIIKTDNVDIDDIPGFSAGCNCYLTPVKEE